VQFLST